MNNSVLVAIAAIGGLWWLSKRPNTNPRRSRYRRNPFAKYDPATAGGMDQDNYYDGLLNAKYQEILDIYNDMGYPYPDPKTKKKYAPVLKELMEDVKELKMLGRPDWVKLTTKNFNSEARYIKE